MSAVHIGVYKYCAANTAGKLELCECDWSFTLGLPQLGGIANLRYLIGSFDVRKRGKYVVIVSLLFNHSIVIASEFSKSKNSNINIKTFESNHNFVITFHHMLKKAFIRKRENLEVIS